MHKPWITPLINKPSFKSFSRVYESIMLFVTSFDFPKRSAEIIKLYIIYTKEPIPK